MECLYLDLLGSPHIRLGTKSITGFTTMKAQALLIYLAVTQRVYSRDALAGLLWLDVPDRQAKKNLRNTLPNLRVLVGSHLIITRHSVAFNQASPHRLDVEVFRSTLASPHALSNVESLQKTTALYCDDFLSGFHVRDAPAFEEWALMEREHLRGLAIDALLALADQCITQQDYSLGLSTTRRLLVLDPWREGAYQKQMLLLAHSGQRHEALAQYDTCRTILAQEFHVEPMAETTALYEQIKAGTLPTPPMPPNAPPPRDVRPGSPAEVQVDIQSTARVDWGELPKRPLLYGRDRERSQLQQWTAVEETSLVGIFGLGGQGKTTLGADLVWKLAELKPAAAMHNGATQPGFERIVWRSLVNGPLFSEVLSGWLSFLSHQPVTPMPPQLDEQLALLFDYLRRHRCLLILDDVEHILLQEGTSSGTFRPGYEAYEQMLQQLSQRVHHSCLLLISRVQPKGFDTLDFTNGGVHTLHLRGLSPEAGEQFLRHQHVNGCGDAIRTLMARYSGHPLALKLGLTTVRQFFAGDLEAFLNHESLLADDVCQILNEQFMSLSELEQNILFYLAAHAAPTLFPALQNDLSPSTSRHALLDALRTLQRRSLLEIGEDGFCLPTLVSDYLRMYTREAINPTSPVHVVPY